MALYHLLPPRNLAPGDRVSVWWDGEERSFDGVVLERVLTLGAGRHEKASGVVTILYDDDRTKEYLDEHNPRISVQARPAQQPLSGERGELTCAYPPACHIDGAPTADAHAIAAAAAAAIAGRAGRGARRRTAAPSSVNFPIAHEPRARARSKRTLDWHGRTDAFVGAPVEPIAANETGSRDGAEDRADAPMTAPRHGRTHRQSGASLTTPVVVEERRISHTGKHTLRSSTVAAGRFKDVSSTSAGSRDVAETPELDSRRQHIREVIAVRLRNRSPLSPLTSPPPAVASRPIPASSTTPTAAPSLVGREAEQRPSAGPLAVLAIAAPAIDASWSSDAHAAGIDGGLSEPATLDSGGAQTDSSSEPVANLERKLEVRSAKLRTMFAIGLNQPIVARLVASALVSKLLEEAVSASAGATAADAPPTQPRVAMDVRPLAAFAALCHSTRYEVAWEPMLRDGAVEFGLGRDCAAQRAILARLASPAVHDDARAGWSERLAKLTAVCDAAFAGRAEADLGVDSPWLLNDERAYRALVLAAASLMPPPPPQPLLVTGARAAAEPQPPQQPQGAAGAHSPALGAALASASEVVGALAERGHPLLRAVARFAASGIVGLLVGPTADAHRHAKLKAWPHGGEVLAHALRFDSHTPEELVGATALAWHRAASRGAAPVVLSTSKDAHRIALLLSSGLEAANALAVADGGINVDVARGCVALAELLRTAAGGGAVARGDGGAGSANGGSLTEHEHIQLACKKAVPLLQQLIDTAEAQPTTLPQRVFLCVARRALCAASECRTRGCASS
jgi:hypothetical protein